MGKDDKPREMEWNGLIFEHLGTQTRGKQNAARRFATKQDGRTAKPAQMPIVPQGKGNKQGRQGGRKRGFRV